MANHQPSPLALLLAMAEEKRQRCQVYEDAHMVAHANVMSQISEAHIAYEEAQNAYSAQAVRVLSHAAIVVATPEEIEALVRFLQNENLVHAVRYVVVRGPVPDANEMDPNVAILREALEAEGFVFQDGNTFLVPDHLAGAGDAAGNAALEAAVLAAAVPTPAAEAPGQAAVGGGRARRSSGRRSFGNA